MPLTLDQAMRNLIDRARTHRKTGRGGPLLDRAIEDAVEALEGRTSSHECNALCERHGDPRDTSMGSQQMPWQRFCCNSHKTMAKVERHEQKP